MTGGYVGDIEYAPHFVAEIAPAWLDLTLLIGGREPPSRRDGFTWCELGCGPGVTAALLAATHPRGRFHAVDMLPAHIEQASRLRDAVRADNLVLHEADFASIAERELPRFDYVVAHGVYSWVDASARAALRRFVERHLAPGGALYLSYNAMPGWRRDAPFQQLVRALATTQRGDSATRFAGAMRAVEAVHAVGAPALAESEMLRGR